MPENDKTKDDAEAILAAAYIDLFLQNLTLWSQEKDVVNAGAFLPKQPEDPK